MLLDYGAEVNATFAALQTTALMTSSFHGNVNIVRTLLDHGANAKAVDMQGSTALGYAFGGLLIVACFKDTFPSQMVLVNASCSPLFCLIPVFPAPTH